MNCGFERDDFRYTAYFCEENIWWLAHDLVARGISPTDMQVLLLTNDAQSIAYLNQRSAPAGAMMLWDYHVVLQATVDGDPRILDFDTRLSFCTLADEYLARSLPVQSELPGELRARARIIPAASYLKHFYSDRSHMRGLLPESRFPSYPIIQPADGNRPVDLAEYRDLEQDTGDDSRVVEASHSTSAIPAGPV